MAEMPLITRRAALIGALTGTAALAVTGVAAVPAATETAIDRFHRHFAGLVEALDEIAAGGDGWMLQCGRHVHGNGESKIWHKQQRRMIEAKPVAGLVDGAGRPVYAMNVERHVDLVIGAVEAE